MQLVKTTISNHNLINELLVLSNKDNEMGYAFPRGDIEDVENELNEYGINVYDCFYMIKDKTNIIGIIGVFEVENDKAIIIGPVMYKKFYSSQNVNKSIELLLNNMVFRYKRVSFDVLKENVILINVLEQNKFILAFSSVSMKLHLNDNFIKSDDNFEGINLVHMQDKSRLVEIDNLFHSTLSDWEDECVNSLYDYLEEGYQIAVVIEDNQVIGSIIWIWFHESGYERIEYLAIQKPHQRKGLGGVLIDYVLSELSKTVNKDFHNYFHLDFNIENDNAYKLYLKKGFEIEYQDSVYTRERNIMICPYCDKEMLRGSIDVYDTLSWSPEGESRKGTTRLAIAPNGVLLAKCRLLFAASKEAYYCESCKKIIIDVE